MERGKKKKDFKGDYSKLKQLLSSHDWNHKLPHKNADDAWSTLKNNADDACAVSISTPIHMQPDRLRKKTLYGWMEVLAAKNMASIPKNLST